MNLPATEPTVGDDLHFKARQQLTRILESRTFHRADGLKRFISFVVEETLSGRGSHLKEFLVGMEVFGRNAGFDPSADPIVRVQARRLRRCLARYYRDEGQEDDLLIDIPKGGYASVITPNQAPPSLAATSSTTRDTVVVLPYADHSSQHDQEYFCKRLGEELIRTLARLENLRAVHADSDTSLETNRLNAGFLIQGSIRRSCDDFRITTDLIDGVSGRYLWSDSVDRRMEDVFGICQEVAAAVAKRLVAEVSGGTHPKGQGLSGNSAADNLYIQGRYHIGQRTEEGLRLAVELFQQAIAEDEHYAQAYAGLSDAIGLLGHYGVLSPAEVWTKVASNAAWAVALDDTSAEAHTSLAHVKATQDWDWSGAERDFQRALVLDPQYSAAHHWYAISCLAPLRRLDQACEEMMLAQALDPISSIIGRDLGRVYYYKQDYEAALDQCDRTVELNPHFSPAYWILGLVQEQRGDFDESTAAFQRAIELSPQSPFMQAALGRTYALSGKADEALRIHKTLEDLAEKRYVPPVELALIDFAMGRIEEGFQWLERAFQDRCFELIYLGVDPRWESLRGDPKFHKLFDQLGLP